MKALRYALIGDGTSDKALLPIIKWTLRHLDEDGEFAEPTFFPRCHRNTEEYVCEIAAAYQFDLIFVHRDAERESRENRLSEIPTKEGVVPIIPVRMTETWLLIDEDAIRRAADNPNGRVTLALPAHSRLESLADPKEKLHHLLKVASEKTGRRLKKYNVDRAIHRLSEIIGDFSPLVRLNAFAAFKDDLKNALSNRNR